MSDLQAIKRKLLDENRVEDILTAIGCEYVGYSGGRVEAQLPEKFNSNNKRAVQVKLNNENLTSSIRTPVGFKGGDIYNLVSFLVHEKRTEEEMNKNLHEAKKFICETLGWTEFLKGGNYKTKKDYVAPLKAILKGKQRKREIVPNPILPEEIMEEFYYKGNPLPFKEWIDEGISYNTQVMYGVGFDLDSKRVVFPLRNRFGQLVGVKGRIMKTEDDPERKYLYIYRCNNRYEWFNFHFAHPYILESRRVYIVESEKSAMKLFEYGIYNAVAIGASDMSIEQTDMIKQLGLDIEIILCYDKGITISEVIKQAEHFKGRRIFGMVDSDDLLEGKDAPVDKGKDVWNMLVEDYIYPINFE